MKPYTLSWNDQKLTYQEPIEDRLAKSISLPLGLIDGRPSIKLQINDRQGVDFVIDSGASYSFIRDANYEGRRKIENGDLRVDINGRQVGGKITYALPDQVSADGQKIAIDRFRLDQGIKVSLLGADFLQAYDIFVDIDRKTIHLLKND